MTKTITEDARASKNAADLHALGRLGEPEDVARTVARLLDFLQIWIAKRVSGVDGGLAALRSRRA